MSLRVAVDDGGTNGGWKKAWVGGHGKKCQCSKCQPSEKEEEKSK